MTLEWVLEPVSAEAPCGPDLDATDDPVFLDYYYDALGRIPERYIRPGKEGDKGQRLTDDWVFDPKSIDIKAENAALTGLLERSRDMRLLVLLAQFECLAGRLEPMVDAVEALASTMEAFGDALHPQPESNLAGRRDAVQELAQPIAIITALRHMGLVGSATVTLRLLNVADGRLSAHSGEGDVSGAALRGALAAPENRKAVDATHSAFGRLVAALERIRAACGQGVSPFTPNLSPTLDLISEIRSEIVSARPDLRGADEDIPAPSGVASDDTAAEDGTSSGAEPSQRPQTTFSSHAEARQALVAIEVYFARHEPSSASLLLVRQARQLIGQPLVVALEALLPEKCGQATVDFGAQTGFLIPAARLKSLSDEGLPGGVPEAPPPPDVADPPTITQTADVAAVLRSVEAFFHAHERSSPVPVLLQRARSYLDKSFQEIVDELIPKPG